MNKEINKEIQSFDEQQLKPFEVVLIGFNCLRCGHIWVRKKVNPICCPACKSPYWKTERKTKSKPPLKSVV